MAQDQAPKLQLLQWTKASSGDDIADPLGLELRVLTRLQNQLLHCITSITPRARYYAFLPWCVAEYCKRERGMAWAEGLPRAVMFRERALALGCVALHDGKPCEGGGVVGSDRAIDYLSVVGNEQVAIREFSKQSTSTAWGQYFGSLVNLGIFVEMVPDLDADENGTSKSATIDALTLSQIGQQMADAYGRVVGGSAVVAEMASNERNTTLSHLSDFASHGGICEIMLPDALDRSSLRDLFFFKVNSPGRSHAFRRQTLLLLMQIIGELGPKGVALDERRLADVVYFGVTRTDGVGAITPTIPLALEEIRLRWRVYYIQFYFSLAFEALFRALVQAVGQAGSGGLSISEFVDSVGAAQVAAGIAKLLGNELGESLLDLNADELLHRLGHCGCPPFGDAAEFEKAAHIGCKWSEHSLAAHLRLWRFPLPADAFAAGLVCLIAAMARYRGETNTPYGLWLQNCVEDAARDLAAPSFDAWFENQGGDWMRRPLRDVVPIIVERFLVRLHEWLGYEKGNDNSRIIIHACEGRLFSTGTIEKLGVHNTRLRNALQVLTDLVLIRRESNGLFLLTDDGRTWLERELEEEVSS